MRPPKRQQSSKIDTNRKSDPAWEPTERQRKILENIHTYGFLTDPLLMRIENIGQTRVRQLMAPLFHNQFVYRPNPKVRAAYDFMFYWLAPKGAEIVAGRLNMNLEDLDWLKSPRWGQIEHDALVSEFQLILRQACDHSAGEFTFLDWVTETTFRRWKDIVEYSDLAGKKATKRMEIDGYARIRRNLTNGDQHFSRLMPEIELSPKYNARFVEDKILPGLAYLQSPIYQKRFGSKSGRWLYLVTSRDKLDGYRHAASQVLRSEDRGNFYFAVMERVTQKSVFFEPIWWRPGDRQPLSLYIPSGNT